MRKPSHSLSSATPHFKVMSFRQQQQVARPKDVLAEPAIATARNDKDLTEVIFFTNKFSSALQPSAKDPVSYNIASYLSPRGAILQAYVDTLSPGNPTGNTRDLSREKST